MEDLLDDTMEVKPTASYFNRSRRIGNIAGIIVLIAVLIILIARLKLSSLDDFYSASLIAGFGIMVASFMAIKAAYLGMKSLIVKEKAPNYRYILLGWYILLGSLVFIIIGTNIADALN